MASVSAKSLMNDYADNISEYLEAARRYTNINTDFNRQEAQKNRDWQQAMSATAHQREVADLKAAGINPILSAYSSGAATGSGAVATADSSYAQALANLAEMSLTTAGSLASAIQTSEATKYAAKTSAGATKAAAKTSAKATKTAAKTSAKAAVKTAKINAATQKKVAAMNNATSKWIANENNKTAVKNVLASNKMKKTVAKISAKTNIKVARINSVTKAYGDTIAYVASIKETNAKTYREMMKTLTQEISRFLNTSQSNVTSILGKLIELF